MGRIRGRTGQELRSVAREHLTGTGIDDDRQPDDGFGILRYC